MLSAMAITMATSVCDVTEPLSCWICMAEMSNESAIVLSALRFWLMHDAAAAPHAMKATNAVSMRLSDGPGLGVGSDGWLVGSMAANGRACRYSQHAWWFLHQRCMLNG